MALHHRKLLPAEADKSYAPSCYMCYVCPDDCYLQPPPPQPPPFPPKTHQISTIFILMLCVLAAVFLFLSYLTVRKFRNSRRGNSAGNGNLTEDFIDEHQAPLVDHPIWYIRTVGLPQSAIDSISVFKYKKGDGLIEGCDCSICLNEFQENESLRLLPKCSHAFHVLCIDTWLRSHKNCPVCRAPILISTNVNANLPTGSSETSNTNSNEAENAEETPDETTRGMADENRRAMPVQDDTLAGKLLRNGNFRVLSDLTDHWVRSERELQQVRRVVSMDHSLVLDNDSCKKGEGCSGTKLVELVEKQDFGRVGRRGCRSSSISRLIKSSSYGRSLAKGPVSMKRSFSFSGKRWLRKNGSRTEDSVPIPEISIQSIS
ncbi:E3 ubiquitin-protein ligase RING1-like isoform X2 [Sesamum indicum]|uniref:RING-type E3 ubiquitin transferase n=1 Tax=Sesamum indicum TaxID=4182 RepID=A0A6I9UGD4_SESIN|nr:E3 ubiquitin-protein ligase RING1-like isoform X2 [Sesamum indicum]